MSRCCENKVFKRIVAKPFKADWGQNRASIQQSSKLVLASDQSFNSIITNRRLSVPPGWKENHLHVEPVTHIPRRYSLLHNIDELNETKEESKPPSDSSKDQKQSFMMDDVDDFQYISHVVARELINEKHSYHKNSIGEVGTLNHEVIHARRASIFSTFKSSTRRKRLH